MESTRHLDCPRSDPLFCQTPRGLCDARLGARDDRLPGRVQIRNPHTLDRFDDRADGIDISARGGHRAQIVLRGLYDRSTTGLRQGDEGVQVNHARAAQGGVFARAVTSDHVRPHTQASQ